MVTNSTVMTDDFKTIYVLAAFINLVLFTYILVFISKLEQTGCKCQTKDWRKSYIIGYSVFMMVLSIYELIVLFSIKDAMHHIQTMRMLIMPLYIGLGVLFVVAALQYVHRLEKEKCDTISCPSYDKLGSLIITIVAAIDAGVFAILGMLSLSTAVMFAVKAST